SEEARRVLDPRRRYRSAIRAEGHAGLSDRHARLTSAVAVRRITAVDVIELGPLEAIYGNSLSGVCDHQRIGRQCKTEHAPPPKIQLVHRICPRTLGLESMIQTVCDPRSELTEIRHSDQRVDGPARLYDCVLTAMSVSLTAEPEAASQQPAQFVDRADLDLGASLVSNFCPDVTSGQGCVVNVSSASTLVTRRPNMPPRLDNPSALFPDGFEAMVALEKALAQAIDPELLELVKLRASQINRCAFCIYMHTTDLRKRGVDEM